MGRGREGAGWGKVGLKSLNSSSPRPTILPHLRPTIFAGQGKPARGEAGKDGLSGAWKNCHPYPSQMTSCSIYFHPQQWKLGASSGTNESFFFFFLRAGVFDCFTHLLPPVKLFFDGAMASMYQWRSGTRIFVDQYVIFVLPFLLPSYRYKTLVRFQFI